MLSFSQICSHMRNLACMVTMKKKKTGHDEMTLSFEESSVGLPLHLSVSKKIRNEIDVKLKKLTTFFSGKL